MYSAGYLMVRLVSDLLAPVLQPGALITLLVLAGSIVLFVGGWLAPELTGLLAAGLLMAFGVLDKSEGVEGFGSPAVITLMGMFGISAGLMRTGALDGVRAVLSSDAVRSPRRMITWMALVLSPVSAFIPNAPLTQYTDRFVSAHCSAFNKASAPIRNNKASHAAGAPLTHAPNIGSQSRYNVTLRIATR